MQLHILHPALEFGMQVPDVFGNDRANVGVHDRGLGPLVFLHFRNDLRRDRNGDIREDLLRDFAGLDLVIAIRERVDERDREGLNVLPLLESAKLLLEVGLVEFANHIATGANALFGFDGALKRGERIGLVEDNPTTKATWDIRARNLQHLSVTLRGDQADAGTGVRQDRVGRDRRAVHHMRDQLGINSSLAAHTLNSVEHTLGGILRRRRHFRSVC